MKTILPNRGNNIGQNSLSLSDSSRKQDIIINHIKIDQNSIRHRHRITKEEPPKYNTCMVLITVNYTHTEYLHHYSPNRFMLYKII